jgi:CTP:molybdopterin cytidylyltransferase MocA
MRPAPAILILAAGASRRMRGADKLLETVGGEPVLLRAARAACRVAAEVIVALPAGDTARTAWLTDLALRRVRVEPRAMSASIRAGVAACRGEALTIMLADMPEIGAPELAAHARAWAEGTRPILQATTADGRPGQPVTFARALFPELAALTGDAGARSLLLRHPVARHALPGAAAITDLDTPEDWAAWRARTGAHV